jgi:Aminoglycoside-2''-adenylyltransferase
MTDGRGTPDPESFEPDLEAWDAWRPEDVSVLLAEVRAPWYVAGGWALDLFLGYERRAHDDLEIAVPHDRFDEVAAALAGYEFFVIADDRVWPLARAGNLLATEHQTWVREQPTGSWRLDIFREPSAGDLWVCRRDSRLQLPYERLIARTDNGIPYAQPEVVLLFKAKAMRPKDASDFAAVLPRLAPHQRHWLREALMIVHPDHSWLAELPGENPVLNTAERKLRGSEPQPLRH